MTRVMRSTLTLMALLASPVTWAQLGLAKDDPPGDPAWKKPATLSYTHHDGAASSASVDAVLRYKKAGAGSPLWGGASGWDVAPGAYIHRDDSSSAPKNDRGIQLSVNGVFVPGNSPAGAVIRTGLNGTLKYGESLQYTKNADGTETRSDKTKEREIVKAWVYYQPVLAGVPTGLPDASRTDVPSGTDSRLVMYFEGFAGLYSDNNRGGSAGSGRLSGSQFGITANVAPFGLDPAAKPFAGMFISPTLQFSAQTQRDFSASGDRREGSYTLYSATLTLAFAKMDATAPGLVPSFNLSRSTGADLLGGRPKSGKTEVSLGLAF